ncbi:hypothetical protein ABC733_26125 [Mangrovibacter sp. SLW1]
MHSLPDWSSTPFLLAESDAGRSGDMSGYQRWGHLRLSGIA